MLSNDEKKQTSWKKNNDNNNQKQIRNSSFCSWQKGKQISDHDKRDIKQIERESESIMIGPRLV